MTLQNVTGSKAFVPVAAVVWLVATAVIFAFNFVDFSVMDRQLKTNIVVTPTEIDLDNDLLVLDVALERYVYHDVDARLTDTDVDGFMAALEARDTRNYVDSVALSELNQITLLLSQDADPDEFTEGLPGLDTITSREVTTVIATVRPDVIPEAFIGAFAAVRLVESVNPVGDDRFILRVAEGANVEAFVNANAALQDNTQEAFIAELLELNLILEEADEIDAFVEQYSDHEDVELVAVSLVTRLTMNLNEGANPDRVADDTHAAFNDFFPRANLMPSFWLPTFEPHPERLIRIAETNTGIALFWITLIFAVVEGALAYVYRGRDEKLFRPLLRVVAVYLVFWSFFGHRPFWDFLLGFVFPESNQLLHPTATVIRFTAQHLELVIVSSIITISSGLAIGIVVTRDNFREFLPLVNNIVNSGQTIPTLAIIAIMAPIIGFGFWPAIIALIAYGLLPVVRNTVVGLERVDAFIIDSARGMGLTPTQILFQIELPIASRVIMAGVRTSTIINVGTATLGAFVGSGGLGVPIASGLSMTVDAFVLLGALPAALLAILIDYILGRLEYVITPRGLQIER